jgi:Trk-type K+ transport system membrane component
MTEALIVVSAVALVLATISLAAGVAALSMVIGIKNSTHQVVWKPVEEVSPDPFIDSLVEETMEPVLGENPNKRKARTVEEAFADMDDPTISSNFKS